MKKITTTLALLLAVVTLTNCSAGGFSTGSSTGAGSSNNDAQGTGGTGGGGAIDNPEMNSLDLQGQVDEDPNPTVQTGFGKSLAIDFDKDRGEFVIMVPMPSGFLVVPQGVFPKYPDITFQGIMDFTSGKMKLAVRIPVKYFIKGLGTTPKGSLPNGDPLPAMPSGYSEMPSLGLTFSNSAIHQISLYIGVDAIGVYVELPANSALSKVPFEFTIPIRNKDKSKVFADLTFVPAKGNYAPGLFVATVLPPKVSQILEDYFKL